MGGAMSVVIKGDSNVNLDFTTGGRITGDFSNATVANRVMFQSSVTNTNTNLNTLPNGTSVVSGLVAFSNSSDPANSSTAQLLNLGTEVAFRGDRTGTGTFLPMTFYTSGSERVRIDTSGNVGVGVTPSAWASGNKFIDVNASASYGAFGSTDSMMLANAYWNGTNWIRKNANNAWRMVMESSSGAPSWTFQYAGNSTAGSTISWSEAMRIDTSGNVGIGTSSPTSKLHVSGGRTDLTANSETFALGVRYNSSGGLYYIGATNSATPDMVFSQVGGSERMRLTNAGNLLVGTTSPSGVARLTISGGSIVASAPTSASTGTYQLADDGSSPNTIRFYNNTDSNNSTNRFIICDAAASVVRAELRSNGGLANYSGNNVNLSDRREKTNFAPAKSYLDTICAIPVQTFNYADQNMEEDGGLTLGVVAQDVQAVAPELVMESNWGTQDEPKQRLSIYQTDLQYALMKSIQELKAMNDTLTARVAQLEAK